LSRRSLIRLNQSSLLLDFHAEEKVEGRPDRRDRGQLGQLSETGCDGRTEDVGGELKLKAEGQKATKIETYRCERGHTFPSVRDTNEPYERDHSPGEHNRRPGGLNEPDQDFDNFSQIVLSVARGDDHRSGLSG
jgi:hypothetical protein